jgi:hypothetical protein
VTHTKQLVFVGTLLVGCQSGVPTTPEPAPEPETAGPVLPVAIGPERASELVQAAALAFQASGGDFVGGYSTHAARIRGGAIEVTPYTFAKGERIAHAPLGLETSVVTVDDAVIGSYASSQRLDNGSVVLVRGDVDERLTNQPDGLHQEWRFASAPELIGDLVVDVAVTGYRYTGTTAGGLHFATEAGTAGVRYSHALWLDAKGAEWPIEATFVDGRIRMTVPESVIAQSAFPAVLDPTIGSEVSADTPHVAMAFGGGQYLVVWDDNRNSADADIWGTRVSAAGAVLDSLNLQIAAGAGIQSNPSVSFNGTDFVVAYEDFKVSGGAEADIKAVRVSGAGAVTAIGNVAATGASETKPAIASRPDGNSLVTWNGGGNVNGAIVTGAVGAGFVIGATAIVERAGVAANPGGDYLVTFSNATDLKGQFVSTAGAVSGAQFDVSAALNTQLTSTATFDGTNFDVIWTNNNAGINLFGSRVTTAGTVLDTRVEGAATVGGVAISTAADNQEFSSIACQASGCLVVWQERRNIATTGSDVYAQRINLDFTLAGGEVIVRNATGNQFTPVAASSGAGFLTGWQDLSDNAAFVIFTDTVSSAGAPGTAIPVAQGNNRESNPQLGRAGGTFGIFWSDSRTYGNDIRFVRVNANGIKLDASSLVASSATFAQINPSASTDLGANTLVVWSDTRNGANKDIFGARVSMATGTPVDAAGFSIAVAANDQLLPSVASNGTVALVVWQDRRGANADIFGALVNSSGAVTLADIVISNAAGDQTRPSVTFDTASGQFLVVWADGRAAVNHPFGARVSTAGAVLDAAGVQLSNGAIGQFTATIATSAVGSMVVWEDRRDTPGQGFHVYGTRVTGGASLTVLDPAGIKISNAAGNQAAPKLTSIGTSYVVVWVDSRNGANTDIFGQQISTGGALVGAEFPVSASAEAESGVSILGSSLANQARIVYQVNRFATERVMTRALSTTGGNGGTCTSAGQCASGFCVDGKCCDTACGGGVNTDCQACSAAKTGQPDGTCSPIGASTVCRNYVHPTCDQREYCDGVNPLCPADIGRNAGAVCNRAQNVPPGAGTGVCPAAGAPGPHPCT